ncbi:D-alanine-D-alanine ligase [Prosthecomicrobium pneumaticum]|uniref:D-alanine--D-alanine ligase n=2 Tax=Prosthecomicrobium pneumaticum TaxID=81895 RepID=A0A7W9L1V5_9HYPH|nr:D-alanine--D-alanine ligase [Prosthecomicrobium pneumaticum]MBB5753024.1 D-alanine-D-alanine ligase [Prosthecomicrobium pneumaticum]
MKHVAVLMGGWSSERPVSLNSGHACAAALREAGYRVTEVDVGRDVADVLARLKPDVVFNALHGPFGEDGCVQGVLEILGLPYTHSGVLASSLAMNKARAKDVMKAAGIPVAESVLMHRLDVAKAHVMEPPYVVKPVAEGSSFGVLIVRADAPHPPQQLFAADWPYGEIVMVERYVAGRELTCGVMGDEALDIIELVTAEGHFYDYDQKYSPDGARHVIPAPLLPDVYQTVRMLAVRAHRALGCRGISRSDFRYDDRPDGTGALVCLEVNTQPGMTATSLVPDMAAHAGIDFPALMRWMVEDASCSR